MAYAGKLDIAGSFRSSQPSSSIIEKYESTISSLTSSNLEGSHWERKEAKDEIRKISQHKSIFMKIIETEKSKWQKSTFGFLSLSNSIALKPYSKKGKS